MHKFKNFINEGSMLRYLSTKYKLISYPVQYVKNAKSNDTNLVCYLFRLKLYLFTMVEKKVVHIPILKAHQNVMRMLLLPKLVQLLLFHSQFLENLWHLLGEYNWYFIKAFSTIPSTLWKVLYLIFMYCCGF